MPLNLTMSLEISELKCAPLIVTIVSAAPDSGLKFVMTGEGFGDTGLVVSVTGGGVFGWSPVFLQETESTSMNMQKAGIIFIKAD